MKVKEVADLVGISVRTLHHYDEIGLLLPTETTEAGYRLYSDKDLETLQQILFFKELGFPLKKIKEIMHSPSFDQEKALTVQHKMLLEKKDRLQTMIDTVEKTIQHLKGERQMSTEEKFAGFDFRNHPYEEEARNRWGDKAVDDVKEKVNNMTVFDQEAFNNIFRDLASMRHESPASKEVQEKMHEWYLFLNRLGTYSLEAFKGLGAMYVSDERFTKNIDQFGEGLATFMCKTMDIYAKDNQN